MVQIEQRMLKRRLNKELRPLFLPWILALLAAAATPVKLFLDDAVHPGEFWAMVLGILPFCFLGSFVALAVSPFGAEFQHRTLPLLLAQPVARARLWKEKLLLLGTATVSIVLSYLVVYLATRLVSMRWFDGERGHLTTEQVLLAAIFLLATVCSAAFWTLQTRSLLGGMTLCIAAQIVLAVAVALTMSKIYGDRVGGLEDRVILRAALIVGTLYSGGLLWLGWRKFSRFELKAAGYGEGAPLTPDFFPWKRVSESRFVKSFSSLFLGWLRCGPRWGTLNLIRKELRLQKPLFLLAAVFSLCWLATLGLLVISSGNSKEVYETILNALTAIWVPLLAVLAGCVSLGEEKTMGVAEWQLTLPISSRWQWVIKLVVSAAVGIVLAVGLPLALAVLTTVKSNVGLIFLVADPQATLPAIFWMWGVIFVVGFWAVTLLGTTVRAALNTTVMVVGLSMFAVLGVVSAAGLLEKHGYEQWLLLPLMIRFQLPPNFLETERATGLLLIGIFASPVIFAALVQSLKQFRRATVQRWTVWKYTIYLLGLSFLMGALATDVGTSCVALAQSLNAQLLMAVRALPKEPLQPKGPTVRTVTVRELEETGELTPLAREWLRGATIELGAEFSNGLTSKDRKPIISVRVNFPNGRRYGPVVGLAKGSNKGALIEQQEEPK